MKRFLLTGCIFCFLSQVNASKESYADSICKKFFIEKSVADTSMFATYIKIRVKDCDSISTILVSNAALYDYLKRKCKYKYSFYKKMVSNAILNDEPITIPDKIKSVKVLIPLDGSSIADVLYREKGLEAVLDFYVTSNNTMKLEANDFFSGVGILFENNYLVRLNDVEGGLAVKKISCDK